MRDFINLSTTGARIGDILIGIQKCTLGVVIQINEDIKPLKKHLQQLRESSDEWSKFINGLSTIDFFSKMSIVEREQYLRDNEVEEEFVENINVNILNIGECELDKKIHFEIS